MPPSSRAATAGDASARQVAVVRWATLALLGGTALAAVVLGLSGESLLVRWLAVAVASWALLAAWPVHAVLGRLERALADGGVPVDAFTPATGGTRLEPVTPFPGWRRVG